MSEEMKQSTQSSDVSKVRKSRQSVKPVQAGLSGSRISFVKKALVALALFVSGYSAGDLTLQKFCEAIPILTLSGEITPPDMVVQLTGPIQK